MKTKKIVAVILTMLMLVTSLPMTSLASVSFTKTDGIHQVSNTETSIAPGITENKIITNDESGNNQVVGYAVSLDMSNPTISLASGYANNNGSKWEMSTVRSQANKYMKDTGENIVVAVNADIYDMATGEPTNVLVMNGTIYNEGLGKPYFGVTKDGNIVMGSSLSAETLSTLKEAVGGFYMLLENGVRKNQYVQQMKVPKTAVGRKADGTLIIYTADGRNYPVSNGLSDSELTSIMIGMGCVDVINLDGGGSTTYLARYEGESTLDLKNKPSDAAERAVASSLFVISSAKPSGEFDHASITPNNELYTPTSTVQFNANGVDSSGASATLPEGTYALADESMGTITADGKFTSSGKLGKVTVNYVVNGEAVGSTYIEVVDPDSIYFGEEEVSLGFEKESTLGLTVKYMTRDVNYTVDDIVWTMSDSSMGSFDGLTFTSSDSATVTGTITASYAGNTAVNGTVTAVIGRLPSVAMDFEDHTNEDGTVIKASDYWTFIKGWVNAGGGDILGYEDNNGNVIGYDGTSSMLTAYYKKAGGKAPNASVVDISSGEPVRFGNYSLKLDYDFSNPSLSATEGACVGFIDAQQRIEGTPTGIGMWVYAPEGTPNFWLRIRVRDGNGTVQTVNFTGTEGVNWTGWKYLEADLSKLTGPFSLIGGETIRIMWVPGTGSGLYTYTSSGEKVSVPVADRKGSMYFDNLQFVYGANTDDIDNPVVDSIMVNSETISEGDTVDTNTVSFRASYSDVKNKYTTGVDPSTVAVFVDGKEMTDNAILVASDETIYLNNIELANGSHTFRIRIRDGFGNETIETRTFKVDGTKNYTTVYTESDAIAELGQNYNITLKSNNIADVSSISTDVSVDKTYSGALQVSFADGFEGTYNYNAKTEKLTISATKVGDATSDEIATISTTIPSDTAEGKTFTYSVSNGKIECVSEQDAAYTATFGGSVVSTVVAAGLSVEVSSMVVGAESGKIIVSDAEGNAVADADVYNNNTLIGKTNAEGVLETTALIQSISAYNVSAEKDGKYSFVKAGQSVGAALSADGSPEYIICNATKNNSNSKNISWLTNPNAAKFDSAVLLATKAEYDKNGESALTKAVATYNTTTYEFLGSATISENYAVIVNSATLSDLEPNTEYVYKVGDGTVYSELKSFTTGMTGENTNFFILGDTQTEDKANQEKIFANLANSGITFDFGIQTGDSVENATTYSDWMANLDVYSGTYMSNVDIIHVLGNHEYMGDDEAVAANTIYNTYDEDCYSVTYGNVYIAVLSYNNSKAELQERLDWLKEDAKASNAQWKVLTMHQPSYYTNAVAPSTLTNELVPAAAEEAGIDFVFSGHDHTYVRTQPVTNGAVDEENGVVYYICGTTGGKEYGLTDKSFSSLWAYSTDDFENGIYTTVSATDTEFKLTAYDSNGNVMDTYTKTAKTSCVTDGHTYTYSNGYLTCSVCGHSEELGSYTGFATDKATNGKMYFMEGAKKTGWLTNEEDCYYFNENGIAVTGEVTIPTTYTVNDKEYTENIKYTFNEDGTQQSYSFHRCKDSYTRAFRGGVYAVGWREIDGYYYFFTSADSVRGKMFTGTSTINIYTGQSITFKFSSDGKLLKGSFYTFDDGNTVYYWGPNTLKGWQDIDGNRYYFDESTGYMATGDVEIDGVMYSFTDNGKFAHEGDHLDEDGDGECDACAAANASSSASIFTGIRNFLQRILNFFKRIIQYIKNIFSN